MPLSDEVVIETKGAHLVELRVKRLPPMPQRACVISTEVFQAVQNKITLGRELLVNAVERE